MGAMSFFLFMVAHGWVARLCQPRGHCSVKGLATKGGGPSILQAPNLHSDEIVIFDVCSGPMMALCLAREDAVEGWRELLGPKEVTVAAEQAPERYKLPDAATMIMIMRLELFLIF